MKRGALNKAAIVAVGAYAIGLLVRYTEGAPQNTWETALFVAIKAETKKYKEMTA